VSCAICEARKEKRFCLALHDRICRQCCAEQREVTLDCPSECVYLQQARQHEKRSVGELLGQLQGAELFPSVELSRELAREYDPLIFALSYALWKRAAAEGGIHDRDLIAALTSLAKSYETRVNSGLHYEVPMASPPQQAIAREVQNMVARYREAEQKHLGYWRLRDSDVLRALVFLVRVAIVESKGRPKSRAFIDLLRSLSPEEKISIVGPGEVASRIVMP
jgi:hypothetical protein